MKKLLLLLLLFFSTSIDSFSLSIHDKINQIIKLDTLINEPKIFFVTNLDFCVSCNLSKINIFLIKIRQFYPKSNINLIIESKNKNDGNYLRKKISEVNYYEDNEIFLTETTNTPFVLIIQNKSFNMYFKINNPNELISDEITRYFSKGAAFGIDYKISEGVDNYLSDIEVVNDKSNLKIFDYRNNILFFYDSIGQITKQYDFHDPYLFYEGNKENLERVIKDGLIFNVTIKKIHYCDDTLFVFYDDLLQNIKVDDKKYNAVSLGSFIAIYYGNKLINHYKLKIGNYNKYFYFNQRHIFETFTFPSERNNTTALFTELRLEDGYMSDLNLVSLKKLNSIFNYHIHNLDEIVYKDIDDKGNFVFLIRGKNTINIMNLFDSSFMKRIDLKGIISYNDDIVFCDWLLIDDKLYLLLTDKRTIYFQIYNCKNNLILNEYIYSINNDEIITSKIFSVSNNKFELISRFKNSRWIKNSSDFYE